MLDFLRTIFDGITSERKILPRGQNDTPVQLYSSAITAQPPNMPEREWVSSLLLIAEDDEEAHHQAHEICTKMFPPESGFTDHRIHVVRHECPIFMSHPATKDSYVLDLEKVMVIRDTNQRRKR